MKRFLFFIILLVLPALAQAQTWPEHEDLFLNDYANILDEATEARLRTSLQDLKNDIGVEATVVTLYTRWGYGESGASFEDFATGLFNHWGIGDAEKNDGILILVISEDRDMRVELGKGYERTYDGTAKRIIDDIFTPAFQAGDFNTGIEEGANAVIERIARPHADPMAPVPATDNSTGGSNWPLWGGGILAAILAFLGLKNRHRFQRCPQCGARGLTVTREVQQKATKQRKGEGEKHTRCKACEYHLVTAYAISQLSGSDSSSDGESGGGSSDGGGASGNW